MKNFNINKFLIKIVRKREHVKFAYILILVISYFLFKVMVSPSHALMNPSAVYCTALGYKYIVVATTLGERGLCEVSNEQVFDAWDFLKGNIGQEYSFCKLFGYEIKTIKDSDKCLKFLTEECAVCILENGSEVEVTELMGLSFEETRCGDGSCGIPENHSSCPQDCPSGGWDGYCDKVKDGKIDPDCIEGEDPDFIKPGDLDKDGDVDQNDLNILLSYRNKPASSCPACDLDGDGMITVLDARTLVLLCTRPKCATQ